MFLKSSLIATCQESFLDTCHTSYSQKKPLKKPIVIWQIHSPSSFKTLKIHSCRSPILHCLCSHHNHFISHHYYIMNSHILSTSKFQVGSIFHYDSSQSFILYLYWMMWNSLRSTFQWSCPIDSNTSSKIKIRVFIVPWYLHESMADFLVVNHGDSSMPLD